MDIYIYGEREIKYTFYWFLGTILLWHAHAAAVAPAFFPPTSNSNHYSMNQTQLILILPAATGTIQLPLGLHLLWCVAWSVDDDVYH